MKIEIVKINTNQGWHDRICPWLIDVPPPEGKKG
jgi:hypothetical protein